MYSEWYVAPELAAAHKEGIPFDEWLGDRIPIASYARISADLDGQSKGVSNQHRENVKNARDHGCVVVMCYTDNHISAEKRDVIREAFQQMVRDLLTRKTAEDIPVQGCIAVEYQRVYRLSRDYVLFQDAVTIREGGVFIDGTTRKNLYDSGEHIVGLVNSGVGEGEVKNVRQRAKRHARNNAIDGKNYGAPRRFGWLGAERKDGRVVREGNRWKDPNEWDDLIWLIDEAATDRPWGKIAAALNERGVKPVRAERWSTPSVKSAARNPANCGFRTLNGELVFGEDGEPVVGNWEAPAPPEKYYAILQRIQKERDKYQRRLGNSGDSLTLITDEGDDPVENGRVKYLFSGILQCGRINSLGVTCMSRLVGNAAGGSNKYAVYRCHDPNCRGVGRRVPFVDAHLIRLLLAFLEKNFSHLTPTTDPWHGEELLKQLRQEHDEIQADLSNGKAHWKDVRKALENLGKNITRLEKVRGEHHAKQQERNLLVGWRSEKWEDDMDFSQKRKVINQVFESVVMLPLPPGRGTKSPFDGDLLQVVWRPLDIPAQAAPPESA